MASNKLKIVLYVAISALSFAIANINPTASYLVLIAFIPLILILKEALHKKFSYWHWPLSLLAAVLIGYLAKQIITSQDIEPGILPYVIGLSAITSVYWFTNRQLNSNFGLLTVIILWIAYDYFIISLFPGLSTFFVFNALDNSAFMPWTGSTGFFGLTLWALVSNFLLANIIFDPNSVFSIRIRWLSLVYAIILVSAPIWTLELWPSENAEIAYQTMVDHYKGLTIENTQYAAQGEWLGRTCAWISVLIIIYSLVKRKVKK
jgi:hypothetical protein